jgi:hypothetical protein
MREVGSGIKRKVTDMQFKDMAELIDQALPLITNSEYAGNLYGLSRKNHSR